MTLFLALPCLHCYAGFRLVLAGGASSWLQGSGFSLQWLLSLWLTGSVVAATGLVALLHVGSFWTTDPACIPCVGRWTPNHWAPREALPGNLLHNDLRLAALHPFMYFFWGPFCLIWKDLRALALLPPQLNDARDLSMVPPVVHASRLCNSSRHTVNKVQ